MKEIMSSNVLVQKKFTMKKMLEIHQAVRKLSGATYLYSRQKAVDASALPKLVSFLLTVEPQTTLKIIVEGTNVEAQLEQLTQMLTNEASVIGDYRKRALNSAGSVQI
ncbi:HPr family phosphocarrier protein [Bacillus sp. T33-2]|uniref:HPr family phosphocarrier protein n=1 Tax=Bacillus sp. T33-2 TaxID=2054168 RepID=UPI000C763B5B|nr:HPr family phosphocarrier protein [Bacillus sp. T33-2]PLR89925.1 HPr family phosphocarrier protein [Bacillus sp. T33-2]